VILRRTRSAIGPLMGVVAGELATRCDRPVILWRVFTERPWTTADDERGRQRRIDAATDATTLTMEHVP
jgi:hypothetical protein